MVCLVLESILQAFARRIQNGLLVTFPGAQYWNFYDWSEHLSGRLGQSEEALPDLMINGLFVLALESLRDICHHAQRPFSYKDVLEETRRAAKAAFYDGSVDAFSLTQGGREFTSLSNAIAVLAGIAERPEALCERIAAGEFTECSLSMKCFPYDALLKTDETRWRPHIVDEIRRNYGRMLDTGATSVWETIDGASAFGNAGSLCHGWSAIPICYLQEDKT